MPMKERLTVGTTSRGFPHIAFNDMYGQRCSLQQSSLAEQPAVWFGVDNPKVQIMQEGEWRDVGLPDGALISSRMHLPQATIALLLEHLRAFVETGDIDPIECDAEETSLELQLAFANWARPRGYDLTMTDDGEMFWSLETRNAWLGFKAAHGPDGLRSKGQQLYARIRKTSKYAHQTDKLFEVRVGKAPYDDFVVHGGPGGVYALRDVHFYVLVDGKPMKLA